MRLREIEIFFGVVNAFRELPSRIVVQTVNDRPGKILHAYRPARPPDRAGRGFGAGYDGGHIASQEVDQGNFPRAGQSEVLVKKYRASCKS